MKKIVFFDTEKRHTDLKVRLQYESLTQSEFFRSILSGMIDCDQRLISYLADWREKNKKYSKKNRVLSEKLLEKGKEIKSRFALGDDEIESIFDLLEEEHPEL